MEQIASYLPTDRLHALIAGDSLPERADGATLFADISGFTPLTEALVLALGPQRGAEELPSQLNRVYGALIAEVQRYGGSVMGFAGDAITCWFAEAPPANAPPGPFSGAVFRAAAAALAMQTAMAQFAELPIEGAGVVNLAVKVAVAAGAVRRFVVGDPALQVIDVLAGATLDRLAIGEHLAEKGDVIVDRAAAGRLGPLASIVTWRTDPESQIAYALLGGLNQAIPPTPWPPLPSTETLDATLRPWLLPPVYQRLSAGNGEFLTELRPATALFLRFGGLDFDRDPLVTEKFDAFIRWVQRTLHQYDAWLLQLTIGDKGCYLYATFGAPVAHEDDAVRACLAALELREPRFPYIEAVQIGISQGRMRTGAYGAAERRTYGALGDEVNLAARLMQHAPHGEVLVSFAARRLTSDAFAWEELPPLRVKGKATPITVLRLISREERRTFRLYEPRYSLPMVGREAELATVLSRLERATHGAGQIVLLSAEAGLGKSRLIAEVLRAAHAAGLVAFGGECLSHGTNTSYLVWRTIWRSLFDLDGQQPPSEQIAALETSLARLDPALLPRLPLLGAVLNLEIADNELTASFEPKLRKTALEGMLVEALRAKARQQPLLLVLEDLHWLDPLSDDLLLALGRASADLPVLILCAHRPLSGSLASLRIGQLAQSETLELTSLPPEAIRELVQLKLAQLFDRAAAPPPELLARVEGQAQGNPFYVEELINYLRDRNIDLGNQAQLGQIELPTSLHSLILSRIDQLNEQQQLLIKVASVIGRLFRTSILWGLNTFAARQAALRSELDLLSEMELTPLDSPIPEVTYLFKHVVTQEVTYESLPFATRSVLHGEIGAVIERIYPHEVAQMLDLLAYHYDRSSNEAKRREYLLRAAQAAQAEYANSAAIDYYQRLIPLVDEATQARLRLRLGQVLELVGRLSEADEGYAAALAFAEAHADPTLLAQVQSAIGHLRWRQRDYPEAQRWSEAAYAGFAALNDGAGMALTLNYSGMIADIQGDIQAAVAAYEASLARWRELDDKSQMANVLNNLSLIARNHQGDQARSEALIAESLRLRREVGDRWRVAVALNNLANVNLDQGEVALARAQLSEALELMRQIGDPWMIGNIRNNLANALREAGDYAEAALHYRESLSIYREFGDRWALAYLFEDCGLLAAYQAAPERALRLVGAAETLRTAIGAPLAPAEQTRLNQLLAPALGALSAEAQAAARALGAALPLERAIGYALEL